MHDDRNRDPRQYVQDHPEPGGAFDREIHMRVIVGSGIAVVLLCAVAFALLWALVHEFRASEVARDVPVTPLEEAGLSREAPEPRLIAFPENYLQEIRAEEEARLHSYGWMDDSHQTARIPIERSIDLLTKSYRFGQAVRARPEPREWVPPLAWRDPSLPAPEVERQ